MSNVVSLVYVSNKLLGCANEFILGGTNNGKFIIKKYQQSLSKWICGC